MDAEKTKLIGVVLPELWITQIDEIIKNQPMTNRQDFIREAVQEKLKGAC